MRQMLLAAAIATMATSALAPAVAQQTVKSIAGPLKVETVADELAFPWGLAFLPDGAMLVTERPGRLRRVSAEGKLSDPIKGLPKIAVGGQGGLLDVAIDPDFAQNQMVYLSFSEPGEGGASTAVMRGKLTETSLDNVEVIFRQEPKVSGKNHWGSRLVFARDGTLFITTGDRQKFDPAQDLTGHLGKVLRINRDGSVPKDNPFLGTDAAKPEIWSYGHRNMQGAAIHPETGALWTHEMGPKGGDELNLTEAGKNYGWPLVSWGDHYDGSDIPDPPTRPDLTDAVTHWTPVIAASGMAFYMSDTIPGWRGSMLIGGLRSGGIVRLSLDGDTVKDEERIPLGARIRDVRVGPDGSVYALTDASNGQILRLSPAESQSD